MRASFDKKRRKSFFGESLDRLREIMFRHGCEARCKYLSAWTLNGVPSARGGLEPHFRVLYSAIFHDVPSEIAIRVENGGFLRKQNCCKLLQVYVRFFGELYALKS